MFNQGEYTNVIFRESRTWGRAIREV